MSELRGKYIFLTLLSAAFKVLWFSVQGTVVSILLEVLSHFCSLKGKLFKYCLVWSLGTQQENDVNWNKFLHCFAFLQLCECVVGGWIFEKAAHIVWFYYLNVLPSFGSYFFWSFMITCCISLFLSKPLVPTDLLPPAALTGSYKKPLCVEP